MRHLCCLALFAGALAGTARADDRYDEMIRAQKNLKETQARLQKETGVKPKNDGCDDDRVILKSAQKESREAKLDLSSCKEKTGAERKECEQPLREAFDADKAQRTELMTHARARITCCEHKKRPGCDKILSDG